MASLFFSYSHADESLRDQLEKQLQMLKRQGIIETWHDRRILAGDELNSAISSHVENDEIILLLISPDFIASDYCYDREMLRAMQRHDAGDATVIPVILRACDWHGAPFGKLMATPTDGRPITQWPDRDQAFLEVAQAVRKVAEKKNVEAAPALPRTARMVDNSVMASVLQTGMVRSSNLRLTKTFTERERDSFKADTFEYIAKFFENSLAELSARNEAVEGVFRRIDANRFTAVVYVNGKSAAKCTIFMGGNFLSNGIAYASQETTTSNSFNESLSVDADEQSMFMRSMGMAAQNRRDEKLSQEGAAELYWGILIAPLQQRNR